ncbi:MAG: orotidine-5'-phosphate decarboxylase [Pseudohongiellaceae bacterium]
MTEDTDKRIIVALDFPDSNSTLALLDDLDPALCRVKIGKELFTACGPQLVKAVQKRGFEVFLDLKFHDIPNTVASAVKVAAELGVWMVNIHAAGGRTMMEASRNALLPYGSDKPLLIGVTVLTSMNQEDLFETGINATPVEQVKRLALLVEDCELDGVVCSAVETEMLRRTLGSGFCLVTPGIRRQQDVAADQQRVAGPADAIRAGSDFLVVGRPITRAASPRSALEEFCSEISGVTSILC